MSKLPEPIETVRLYDGYYEVQRPDRDILDDCVQTINELIEFLKDKEEL